MASPPAPIEDLRFDDALVSVVTGDLDLAAARQLRDRVEDQLGRSAVGVVIDLERTEFLDSAALSVLLSLSRRVHETGRALAVVVGPAPQPRARFDLTGTGGVLNVCHSRDEALARVRRHGVAALRQDPADAPLALTLYVNGRSRHAARAVLALDRLRERLPGARIAVIDVHDHPEIAERERVLATPLVVRESPGPACRAAGDLANLEALADALDLPVEAAG